MLSGFCSNSESNLDKLLLVVKSSLINGVACIALCLLGGCGGANFDGGVGSYEVASQALNSLIRNETNATSWHLSNIYTQFSSAIYEHPDDPKAKVGAGVARAALAVQRVVDYFVETGNPISTTQLGHSSWFDQRGPITNGTLELIAPLSLLESRLISSGKDEQQLRAILENAIHEIKESISMLEGAASDSNPFQVADPYRTEDRGAHVLIGTTEVQGIVAFLDLAIYAAELLLSTEVATQWEGTGAKDLLGGRSQIVLRLGDLISVQWSTNGRARFAGAQTRLRKCAQTWMKVVQAARREPGFLYTKYPPRTSKAYGLASDLDIWALTSSNALNQRTRLLVRPFAWLEAESISISQWYPPAVLESTDSGYQLMVDDSQVADHSMSGYFGFSEPPSSQPRVVKFSSGQSVLEVYATECAVWRRLRAEF